MDKNLKDTPVINMAKGESNKSKIKDFLMRFFKALLEVLWLTVKTLVMFLIGYIIWNIKKMPEVMDNVTPRPHHRD